MSVRRSPSRRIWSDQEERQAIHEAYLAAALQKGKGFCSFGLFYPPFGSGPLPFGISSPRIPGVGSEPT